MRPLRAGGIPFWHRSLTWSTGVQSLAVSLDQERRCGIYRTGAGGTGPDTTVNVDVRFLYTLLANRLFSDSINPTVSEGAKEPKGSECPATCGAVPSFTKQQQRPCIMQVHAGSIEPAGQNAELPVLWSTSGCFWLDLALAA